jgi:hypothetical protein
MAKEYTWDIRRRVLQGRETYVWAVIECADGKIAMSGEELLHSSALQAVMRIIRRLEIEHKLKDE